MNNKYFLLLLSFGFSFLGIQNKMEAAIKTGLSNNGANGRLLGADTIGETQQAIDEGADVNTRGLKGWTALMMACVQGNLEKATCLLAHGAGVDLEEYTTGDTPLLFACKLGKLALAELLMDYGADTNLANYYGKTPLMSACEKQNLELIILLLEHGVKIPEDIADIDPISMDLIQEALKRIAEKKAKTPCNGVSGKVIPRTYKYTSIPYFPPMPVREKQANDKDANEY